MTATRHKPPQSPLWTVMAPVKPRILWGIVLSALSALTMVLALWVLVLIIAQLMRAEGLQWIWLLAFGGLTAATFILRLWAFHTSHLAAFRLEVILRESMASRLGKLPLGVIQDRGAGALTKVMHDDVKNLHAFVADTTPLYGKTFAMPLLTVGFVLLMDWRLALVAIAVLVVGIGFMMFATKDYQKNQDRYMAESERVNAALVEFIQAMPVVRTFDTGTLSYSRLQNTLVAFNQFLGSWLRSVGSSAAVSSIIFAPLPTLLAVSIVGVYFIEQGLSAIPNWVGLLLLGSGLAESVMPLMWMNMFVKKANACAERIQDLLATPILPEASSEIQSDSTGILPDQSTSLKPADSSVEYDAVSFAYHDGEPLVLQDVSFTILAGSVTALVGSSGAGKTTVARLLPRFWDVTAGAIRIGGVDIRQLSQSALMSQVSFVFQDTFLFQMSIADNIALAAPNADRESIEVAAKAAYAHDFITELPRGYDTQVGERGASLSGGQRQRITLARAILQDCPIIVLDEATAFADPESEAAIVKALGNLTVNKTILMVAHRLATIQHADQILVFDHGCLVESGDHASLLTRQGRYAELWHHYSQAQDWNFSQSPEEA